MTCVNGTTISMTRGDTFKAIIRILDEHENEYTPDSTDRIIFTAKKSYDDSNVVLEKEIPVDSMLLHIRPEDTKPLNQPARFVYDIQLLKEDGSVYTFIAKAELRITEEVG